MRAAECLLASQSWTSIAPQPFPWKRRMLNLRRCNTHRARAKLGWLDLRCSWFLWRSVAPIGRHWGLGPLNPISTLILERCICGIRRPHRDRECRKQTTSSSCDMGHGPVGRLKLPSRHATVPGVAAATRRSTIASARRSDAADCAAAPTCARELRGCRP